MMKTQSKSITIYVHGVPVTIVNTKGFWCVVYNDKENNPENRIEKSFRKSENTVDEAAAKVAMAIVKRRCGFK
jgi:hypothetical protein